MFFFFFYFLVLNSQTIVSSKERLWKARVWDSVPDTFLKNKNNSFVTSRAPFLGSWGRESKGVVEFFWEICIKILYKPR